MTFCEESVAAVLSSLRDGQRMELRTLLHHRGSSGNGSVTEAEPGPSDLSIESGRHGLRYALERIS
jgi:hypothetical protein